MRYRAPNDRVTGDRRMIEANADPERFRRSLFTQKTWKSSTLTDALRPGSAARLSEAPLTDENKRREVHATVT
jgi:hypothetical protein